MTTALTRGKALGWAHRLKAVASHQREIVTRTRVMPRQGPGMRRELDNDLSILDTIVDEIESLDGLASTPRAWADTILGIADRERAMGMGLLFYDVVSDIATLEETALAIEQVARSLATTGEYALPVDPNAETKPGSPRPLPDPEDDECS